MPEPTGKSGPLHPRTLLSIAANGAADAEPLLTLGSALPKTRNSLPCHYYWRPAICDGDWSKEYKDTDGSKKSFTVHVTPQQRLDWERKFNLMRESGDEVPIVKDHREGDADATAGYVISVKNDGPWYHELHQYLGDDAKDTALRNKISVGIDPDYKDSRKRWFGSTIVHSAITSRPVVPGQGDAVRIAASRAAEAVEIIQLSLSAPLDPNGNVAPASSAEVAGVDTTSADTPTGANTMATLPCSDATLKILHKHVPGLKDAPDDDKLARLAQHMHTMSMTNGTDAGYDMAKLSVNDDPLPADIHDKAIANRKAWKTAADELPTVKHELSTVKADLQAKDGKIVELSNTVATATPTYDPMTMSLIDESLQTSFDSVVEKGGADQSTVTKLLSVLIPNGKPSVLCLSRVAGSEKIFGKQIAEILKDNKPRAMGSQTGIQTLSRTDPGTGSSDTAKAAQDALLAGANPK